MHNLALPTPHDGQPPSKRSLVETVCAAVKPAIYSACWIPFLRLVILIVATAATLVITKGSL